MTTDSPGKLNRLVLPGIVLVFAAPMLVSWWLVTQTSYGRNASDVSHGQLFAPARPLPDIELVDLLDGDTNITLHGKWNLVVVNQGGCNEACFDSLYKIRQIRLATGKYAPRVQRLLLSNGVFESSLDKQLLEQFNGQLFLNYQSLPGAFIDNFRNGQADDSFASGELYLVDPLGNLMLRYAADTEPAGIIKDLKRLLRYSRIG